MSIAIVIVLALFQSDLLKALPDALPTIIDGGKATPSLATDFDAGPAVGNGLNGHFFPGVADYNMGRYRNAYNELTYMIARPAVLDGNPRKPEFLSIMLYLRGMIYMYHSQGLGRHALAKSDFEGAIKWNPANYRAYLELARVYSDLGFIQEASSVIQHLLDLKPDKDVVDEAEKELKNLAKSTGH